MSFKEIKKKAVEATTKAKETVGTLADETIQKASEIDVDKLKKKGGKLANKAKKAAKNIDVDDLKKKGSKLADDAAVAARDTASEVEKGGLVPFLKTKKGMAIAAGALIVLFMVFGGGGGDFEIEIDEHTLEKLHNKYDSSDMNEPVDKYGNTPLIIALAKKDTIKEAYFLISNGADINVKNTFGAAALVYAISNSTEDMAKFLISKGADVNNKNSEGKTALMEAITRALNNNLAKLLIDKGADINARDNSGWTPLMYAAVNGIKMESTIDILIDRGADINNKDNKGQTVLMYQSRLKSPENIKIFKFIIDKGADINAKDNHGFTAWDYSTRLGGGVMAKVLDDINGVTKSGTDEVLYNYTTVPIAHYPKFILFDNCKLVYFQRGGATVVNLRDVTLKSYGNIKVECKTGKCISMNKTNKNDKIIGHTMDLSNFMMEIHKHTEGEEFLDIARRHCQ